MNYEDVKTWESALSPRQREKLAMLRFRKCQVEAVYARGDERHGVPPSLRLSVVVDDMLLASRRETHDIRPAFDAVYVEAVMQLPPPEAPNSPKSLN
ncbi:hypothetical protein [Deinococcus yavapaiensis]|uniref:Uncharacterized protein n=1 Tax=Deinococcus yavapaiensis KR-236 TaxID=694435 RepID=A0A318SE86_9DEIO|nr:hypothetical protein [Deinococcus yavapaiensis]PYE51068.1 hypothetical protein DES52_116135 [Deinococcus yavapaiensis KR-236]